MIAIVMGVISLSQSAPSPIDGFRANFASIRAEMSYHVRQVRFNLKNGLRDKQSKDFIDVSRLPIEGRWACDGFVEYFRFSSPEDVLDRAERDRPSSNSFKNEMSIHYVPRTEAVWDGNILFFHSHDPHNRIHGIDPDWFSIQSRILSKSTLIVLENYYGPFYCGFGGQFPSVIHFWFEGISPTVNRSNIGGHIVEIEVYHKPEQTGWSRLEIAYDPSIGFIPRGIRLIVYTLDDDRFYAYEYFLRDVSLCKSGGFVPIEFGNVVFDLRNFSKNFPNYNESTDLTQGEKEIYATYYSGYNFKDFNQSVSMRETKGIRTVDSIGGGVNVKSNQDLSYNNMKLLVGPKLYSPASSVFSHIDQDELRELDQKPARSWIPFTISAALLAIIGFFMTRRWRTKKKYFILFSLYCIGTSGCGHIGDPIVKLSVAYKSSLVYINPDTHDIDMKMIVRNDGNQTLKILGADGGCACRKVDQAGFPAILKPGKSIPLFVTLSVSPVTMPQSSQFSFSTDHGIFSVNLPYFTIVSHQFDPDVVATNSLNELDDWKFDLTHRYIYRSDDMQSAIHPTFPDVLTVVKMNERKGKLNGAEDYSYTDTTYRLSLKDRSLGLHKNVILLRSSDGRVIHETPVVWNRVPYLSTAPERVAIATRPVRVFLRCPDDQVELLKVLSVPNGLKAVITSTRELTVMLDEHPPEILRGEIEVQTSAQGKPPLKFMVVRYAPSIPKPQSKPTS